MKKYIIAIFALIAISMVLVTGCSKKVADTTGAASSSANEANANTPAQDASGVEDFTVESPDVGSLDTIPVSEDIPQ